MIQKNAFDSGVDSAVALFGLMNNRWAQWPSVHRKPGPALVRGR